MVASALRGRISSTGSGPLPLGEWQRVLGEFFKNESVTFTDLGRHLLESLSELDTRLGRFVKSRLRPLRPPFSAGVSYCPFSLRPWWLVKTGSLIKMWNG